MKTVVASALAAAAIVSIGAQVASACGDKFLTVGRGVRFQRAYAAIHPASILIVLPVKTVKSAAVRDSALTTALKMAGHRVETVQQPVNLAALFARSRYDIVVAERADAPAIRDAATEKNQPAIVQVLEKRAAPENPAARLPLEYVLETPQSLSHILNLLDDVMKARLDALRRGAVTGA